MTRPQPISLASSALMLPLTNYPHSHSLQPPLHLEQKRLALDPATGCPHDFTWLRPDFSDLIANAIYLVQPPVTAQSNRSPPCHASWSPLHGLFWCFLQARLSIWKSLFLYAFTYLVSASSHSEASSPHPAPSTVWHPCAHSHACSAHTSALALIIAHLLFEQLIPKEVNRGKGGYIKIWAWGRHVWL